MTKAQLAALVLTAFGAGAGARSLATVVSGSNTIDVQSICAAKQPVPGKPPTYVQETCGYITEKGSRPRRVCDRRASECIDAMVKAAPAILEKADAEQAAQRAATEKQLAAQRADAGH